MTSRTTSGPDYADKLMLFSRLVEPELRGLIGALDLRPGARVLDAGCGAGAATELLGERAGPSAVVIGLDLSRPHLDAARRVRSSGWVQASLGELPVRPRSLDLIWCSNALHHVKRAVPALARWRQSLRPGGQIVICQSGLLPDMVFAWDSELELTVHTACRRYYREKYGLDGEQAFGWRRGVGWLQEAGYSSIEASTVAIERTAPLDQATLAYLQVALFDGYWGPKINAHLTPGQIARLRRWTNPESPDYALARSDFHFVQTMTCFKAQSSG